MTQQRVSRILALAVVILLASATAGAADQTSKALLDSPDYADRELVGHAVGDFLAIVDDQMVAIRETIDRRGQGVRSQQAHHFQEMMVKRRDAAARAEMFEQASADAWSDVWHDLVLALEDLAHAYQVAVAAQPTN